MRSYLKTTIVGGVASAMLFSSTIAFASAFVLNTGRDGLECAGSVFGFSVVGNATLVITDSNKVMFSCHGIVFEAPPAETVRFAGIPGPIGTSCKGVVTPAGNLNTTCHN